MSKPTTIIVLIVLAMGVVGYQFFRPMFHSPGDRIKIAMGGRSTMKLWFKHWNWPYPLRLRTTYKPWPIPYRRYAKGDLFLEYLPLMGPKSRDTGVPFGKKMISSFEEGLDKDHYEAAFFKFCFVDFPVKTKEEKGEKFQDLQRTVRDAYRATSQRNLKLILGNALPLPHPSADTLALQEDFNRWLREFESTREDVMVFDLYGTLANPDGTFNMALAKAKDDHHPGDSAYTILDERFFSEVSAWLKD